MADVFPAARSRMTEAVVARFASSFGRRDCRLFFAPGRINLVGAHLDYSGGDVMPMAVDRGLYAGVLPRDDTRVRLCSIDQDLEIDVDASELGERAHPELGWGAYPLGIWRAFREQHGVGAGFDAVFAGDIPMASGLSSSAAIEVVTAIALDAMFGVGLGREQIAMLAHRVENDFVGVRCGIMDQYASALARPGHVLWLRCAEPRWDHVPFDPDACEVLVMDTKKPRTLASSGFNERVSQCAAAHAVLREQVADRPHLAAYTPAELESCRAAMDQVLYRRARHVVTEMGRIATGAECLQNGDYACLGEQLDGSHASTATDYDVSCDELEVITDAARACESVYGARLTGAGFGGCAIALIRPGSSDAVRAHVADVFRRRFGVEAGFDLLRIGDGPGEIEPETS